MALAFYCHGWPVPGCRLWCLFGDAVAKMLGLDEHQDLLLIALGQDVHQQLALLGGIDRVGDMGHGLRHGVLRGNLDFFRILHELQGQLLDRRVKVAENSRVWRCFGT